VSWDVDSADWDGRDPDSIATTVLAGARPGSIVLLHDGMANRRSTVGALPAIISGLRDEGYELVTVSTLLSSDG
jgi:peptidoglycan/xylan/chitin deacetylase (PgdA/CDA1 family)